MLGDHQWFDFILLQILIWLWTVYSRLEKNEKNKKQKKKGLKRLNCARRVKSAHVPLGRPAQESVSLQTINKQLNFQIPNWVLLSPETATGRSPRPAASPWSLWATAARTFCPASGSSGSSTAAALTPAAAAATAATWARWPGPKPAPTSFLPASQSTSRHQLPEWARASRLYAQTFSWKNEVEFCSVCERKRSWTGWKSVSEANQRAAGSCDYRRLVENNDSNQTESSATSNKTGSASAFQNAKIGAFILCAPF